MQKTVRIERGPQDKLWSFGLLPKLGMGPFGTHFWIGMGPLGSLGAQFAKWASQMFFSLFLPLWRVERAWDEKPLKTPSAKMGPVAHLRIRRSPFREGGCCLCLWCHLHLCSVPWSVLMTCFCAVSLSGTMRSLKITVQNSRLSRRRKP